MVLSVLNVFRKDLTIPPTKVNFTQKLFEFYLIKYLNVWLSLSNHACVCVCVCVCVIPCGMFDFAPLPIFKPERKFFHRVRHKPRFYIRDTWTRQLVKNLFPGFYICVGEF